MLARAGPSARVNMLALSFAVDLGLHHLMIEGDCAALFTALNQPRKCFSSFAVLVRDISMFQKILVNLFYSVLVWLVIMPLMLSQRKHC